MCNNTVCVKKCYAYVYPFSVSRAEHTVCIFQPYRFECSRMSVLFFYSEVLHGDIVYVYMCICIDGPMCTVHVCTRLSMHVL